ncbi:PH domain-containing protein [Streptomyces sp. S6]
MTFLLAMTLFGVWTYGVGELLVMTLGPTASVLLLPYLSDDEVRLTESGISFRNGFRHRRLRWTDVTHMEIRSLLGVRRLVLHTTTGKHRTLPAPHSFADPGFDLKAREITDWWLRHRA